MDSEILVLHALELQSCLLFSEILANLLGDRCKSVQIKKNGQRSSLEFYQANI
jgi:hypothetical protein